MRFLAPVPNQCHVFIRSFVRKLIYRVLLGILILPGIYQAVTHQYRDEEKELRTLVRTAAKEGFPDQKERYAKTIGLFRYGKESATTGEHTAREGAVVLIHGLDDPGKVWQYLRPALVEEGYNVWATAWFQ